MNAEVLLIKKPAAQYQLKADAPDVPPGCKRTEVGVVPFDWKCHSVHAVAAPARNAIVGGPFGSDLVSKDYVELGVPVIRGQNLNGQWIVGPFVFVTDLKARSLSANLARAGDIVFTQRGTLGQVSLVPEQPYDKYLISQSQMKVTLNRELVDPVFLFHVFSGSDHQRLIREGTIQTGVPHINLRILRSIPVQVPPLPEQHVIAEALSDVDGLLAALEALIVKKRAIKKAAMQQLLTGKTRLHGFSEDWKMKRLGNHVTFLRHGVNSRAELTTGGAVKYLHYGDIHTTHDVYLDPRASQLPTLRIDHAKGLDRLQVGDLVLVDAPEDLEGVGKSVEIRETEGEEIISGLHTIAARFDKSVLADGFKAYLQFCPAFRNHLRRLAAGTKVYATNRAHIASVEVALPNEREQVAIAAVLSDMDAEIAVLEARREKTRSIKQGMMQQLLTGRIRLVKPEQSEEPEQVEVNA
jgi:type I restriction enzyme, S subunit